MTFPKDIELSSAIDHRQHGQMIKYFNERDGKWHREKHTHDHEAFQRFVDADLLHSMCSVLYTEMKLLLKKDTITAGKPIEAMELFFQCTMAFGSTKVKSLTLGLYPPYSKELISIAANYLKHALSDFTMSFAPLATRKLYNQVVALATAAENRYETVTYPDTVHIN